MPLIDVAVQGGGVVAPPLFSVIERKREERNLLTVVCVWKLGDDEAGNILSLGSDDDGNDKQGSVWALQLHRPDNCSILRNS